MSINAGRRKTYSKRRHQLIDKRKLPQENREPKTYRKPTTISNVQMKKMAESLHPRVQPAIPTEYSSIFAVNSRIELWKNEISKAKQKYDNYSLKHEPEPLQMLGILAEKMKSRDNQLHPVCFNRNSSSNRKIVSKKNCTCLYEFYNNVLTLVNANRSNHARNLLRDFYLLYCQYQYSYGVGNDCNPSKIKEPGLNYLQRIYGSFHGKTENHGKVVYSLRIFPQISFCKDAMQNVLGYNSQFRDSYIDAVLKDEDITNKMMNNAVARCIFKTKIEIAGTLPKNSPKKLHGFRVEKKTALEVYHRSPEIKAEVTQNQFERRWYKIDKLLQDHFLIGHPNFTGYSPNDYDNYRKNVLLPIRGDLALSHGDGKSFLHHRTDVYAFGMYDSPFLLNGLTKLRELIAIRVGENGAGNGISVRVLKDLSRVNKMSRLLYMSTFGGFETPMLELVCNKLGYKESWDKGFLRKWCNEFDAWLFARVQELSADGSLPGVVTHILGDAGCMLTQMLDNSSRKHKEACIMHSDPKDHIFQRPHVDILIPEQMQNEIDGYLIMIAFMPLDDDGMLIQYITEFDGRVMDSDKEYFQYIPRGGIVMVPASLVHCGGFRTSITGNKRCHFYIYIKLYNDDTGTARGCVPKGTLSNVYMFLPNEDNRENEFSTFKMNSAWYTQQKKLPQVAEMLQMY